MDLFGKNQQMGLKEESMWENSLTEQRFSWDSPAAAYRLAHALKAHLLSMSKNRSFPEVVLLFIGTDRSTGDSLGPLTGTLVSQQIPKNFRIFGTLDQPVHAANLTEYISRIRTDFPNLPVIAIDACLGKLDNVGSISVGKGSLRPGAGVNKDLPPVGDLYVTGTVNVGGFMEYFVLQNTRLSLVMQMAEVIARGIIALSPLIFPKQKTGQSSRS